MRDFVEHCDFVTARRSNVAFSFQDFVANYERNDLQYHLQYAFLRTFATYEIDHLRRNVNAAQALFHVRASHVYEFVAKRTYFRRNIYDFK
jgi:hypothetical protein